jgi:serine/threonine protein phosphatase PrpC
MIQFKLSAWSEAAGRPHNEDSFLIGRDLSAGEWTFDTDKGVTLSAHGALIVVCDGMGGTNAGEVASALAVETIKEQFSDENLTDEALASPDAIQNHIHQAIIAADRRIKKEAKANAGQAGMGSTIVVAWLLGDEVHIGWCGDSRAYRFNPAFGLEQLSHDHSYVQELVDSGRLAPELANRHPDSNIITRSLGDSGVEAQPDVVSIPIYRNDLLLLCTDGLCGLMTDRAIESVVSRNASDLRACRDALLQAAQETGWTDNVTIALCRITSGGANPRRRSQLSDTAKQLDKQLVRQIQKSQRKKWQATGFFAFLNRFFNFIIL